jgi:NAD(P) transhydrogenase
MSEPSTPPMYDVAVIGAGPAGEKGGKTAAAFGRRVAIIEQGELGGAVANTGTLPSKTLRETALALSGLKARNLYGVDLSLRREATVADFMYHEKHVSAAERRRIRSNIDGAHIDLLHGQASFVDPHTISIQGTGLVQAEKILIATGSSPLRPAEFSFHDVRICDSDEILRLKRLPETLAVVGAGVIGSEYACTFAALGVKVHMIDGRAALLPFLDQEVAAALSHGMERLGVSLHWNERVTKCDAPRGGERVTLTLSSGKSLEADCALVAAGRTSNTGQLNLAAAGITPGERGLLEVDRHFRTSVQHIYAAGDVIGFPALAASSMEQARVAMCHACGQADLKAEISPILPTGIYTIPEVSMVGETEETARAKNIDFVTGKALYHDCARGEIIGDGDGFLKMLFRRGDRRLVGVHAIGEHATELVHIGLMAIGLMAMLSESTLDIFNRACFNYPTLGDMYKYAAYDALAKMLGGVPVKTV